MISLLESENDRLDLASVGGALLQLLQRGEPILVYRGTVWASHGINIVNRLVLGMKPLIIKTRLLAIDYEVAQINATGRTKGLTGSSLVVIDLREVL